MKSGIDIPWHRYGLIAELAARFNNQHPPLGKTALQKIVYLLQKLFDVKSKYNFSLYMYGPFCAELQSDIDIVQTMQGINVESKDIGFEISAGSHNESLRQKASDFLSGDNAAAISKVIEDFAGFSAKELELRATIIYVSKDTGHSEPRPSRDEVIRLIKEIKPRFTEQTIGDALAELEAKGYVDKDQNTNPLL